MPFGAFYFLTFVFGAVIGSFLNVVSLRFNTGLGLNGRSMCMSCGKTLTWAELMPILSFLIQGGRCAKCRTRISWQYPVVEAATGALFTLIAWHFVSSGMSWPHAISAIIYAIASCILVVIAAYDVRHKIIPDSLSYSFSALALASVFLGGSSVAHAPHLWTLLAGPVLALPFASLWAISKGKWIGLGDAKLVLGIGWLLGMNGGVNALILAFWIGAAVSVLWMYVVMGAFKRRTEIPFGPFLILGTFIVLFTGITVLDVRLFASLF